MAVGGIPLNEVLVGMDDARSCLVTENTESRELRGYWRDTAMVQARWCFERSYWDRMMAEAEQAQAVAPDLDSDVLALLSVAYERCGRPQRSEGLFAMARRSRGAEFETKLLNARQKLLQHE